MNSNDELALVVKKAFERSADDMAEKVAKVITENQRPVRVVIVMDGIGDSPSVFADGMIDVVIVSREQKDLEDQHDCGYQTPMGQPVALWQDHSTGDVSDRQIVDHYFSEWAKIGELSEAVDEH